MKSLRFISGHRYIVDNASGNAAAIRLLAKEYGFVYLQNTENRGIAQAINHFEQALPDSITAFIPFDQDSIPQIHYCDCIFEKLIHQSRLGISIAAIGGQVIDTPHERQLKFVRITWRGVTELDASSVDVQPDYLIISGTMISREAFRKSGGFDEQLFVDNVDVEWSYRVSTLGYRLVGTHLASMMHCIGDSELSIPGTALQLNVHSPARMRFMTKSRFLSYRKASLPMQWKLQDFLRFCVKTLLIMAYSDERSPMLKAVLKGAMEGATEAISIAGKTGPT
ncbi:hypothetical protein NOR53_244 [gamma proteobacterium NOR5-3]|nr:hypothetical protein NOR53_244 [gamma proteobacterium NOR5-3]